MLFLLWRGVLSTALSQNSLCGRLVLDENPQKATFNVRIEAEKEVQAKVIQKETRLVAKAAFGDLLYDGQRWSIVAVSLARSSSEVGGVRFAAELWLEAQRDIQRLELRRVLEHIDVPSKGLDLNSLGLQAGAELNATAVLSLFTSDKALLAFAAFSGEDCQEKTVLLMPLPLFVSRKDLASLPAAGSGGEVTALTGVLSNESFEEGLAVLDTPGSWLVAARLWRAETPLGVQARDLQAALLEEKPTPVAPAGFRYLALPMEGGGSGFALVDAGLTFSATALPANFTVYLRARTGTSFRPVFALLCPVLHVELQLEQKAAPPAVPLAVPPPKRYCASWRLDEELNQEQDHHTRITCARWETVETGTKASGGRVSESDEAVDPEVFRRRCARLKVVMNKGAQELNLPDEFDEKCLEDSPLAPTAAPRQEENVAESRSSAQMISDLEESVRNIDELKAKLEATRTAGDAALPP